MLTFSSPAKINLFLHVLCRREDGFHEIATLIQAIDLCDTLTYSLSSQDCFTCSDSSLPLDDSNLVVKAINLFRKKSGISFQLTAHLDKKIPCQAGLGGGSGNAATTLYAINELLGRPYSEDTLLLWAREIGSDVAFFFSLGTAFCTGRGEKIASLPSFGSEKTLWIVKPKEGLPTPLVYKTLRVTEVPKKEIRKNLDAFLKSGSGEFFNDLETPAFELQPRLRLIKEALLAQGFTHPLVSGSGTSIFCFGSWDTPPSIDDCISYPSRFMYRSKGAWYTKS